MQLVEKKIAEIKPPEKDSRKNRRMLEQVADVIKKYGFYCPIIIDSNGGIIEGNTRYYAAKLVGLKTVTCLVTDNLEEIKAIMAAERGATQNRGD